MIIVLLAHGCYENWVNAYKVFLNTAWHMCMSCYYCYSSFPLEKPFIPSRKRSRMQSRPTCRELRDQRTKQISPACWSMSLIENLQKCSPGQQKNVQICASFIPETMLFYPHLERNPPARKRMSRCSGGLKGPDTRRFWCQSELRDR